MKRRQFLKQGLVFVPASFAIRRTLAQVATANDGPFISKPSVAAAGGISANLVLKLESSSFDGSSNGSNVSTWSDLSGSSHDFTFQSTYGGGSGYINPTVSATTLNGHKTVNFAFSGSNTSFIASASRWLNGSATGLSMLLIAKWAASPPVGSQPHGGGPAVFTFHNFADPNTHQPYTDGNFYENFASTARQSLGSPGVNLASGFHKYKLIANSSTTSFKAYLDASNFFTNSSFSTFSVNGGGNYTTSYTLGASFSNVANIYAFEGNIAALYVWEKALSAADQTALDAYTTSTWGI